MTYCGDCSDCRRPIPTADRAAEFVLGGPATIVLGVPAADAGLAHFTLRLLCSTPGCKGVAATVEGPPYLFTVGEALFCPTCRQAHGEGKPGRSGLPIFISQD